MIYWKLSIDYMSMVQSKACCNNNFLYKERTVLKR